MNWYDLGVSAGLGLFDFGTNMYMMNKQHSMSKKDALTSFWMQNYLMNKQNEYNKPINQMKRLEEAGLNPNLVYGGGATTLSASSGSAPMAHAPSNSYDGMKFLDKMAMVAQLRKVDADTRAVDNNIEIAKADLKLREQLNKAQIKNLNSSGRNSDASAHQTELNNEFWDSFLGGIFGGSRAGLDTIKSSAQGVGAGLSFWEKLKNMGKFSIRHLKRR